MITEIVQVEVTVGAERRESNPVLSPIANLHGSAVLVPTGSLPRGFENRVSPGALAALLDRSGTTPAA